MFVCTSAPRPLSLALIFTFPQPAIPPASLMTGPEAPIGPLTFPLQFPQIKYAVAQVDYMKERAKASSNI